MLKTESICRDRLGTNVGKVEKKINFCRAYQEVARRIVRELQARGYLTWFDLENMKGNTGKKTVFCFPMFYTENHHFAKTGSGQTWGKLHTTWTVFLQLTQ